MEKLNYNTRSLQQLNYAEVCIIEKAFRETYKDFDFSKNENLSRIEAALKGVLNSIDCDPTPSPLNSPFTTLQLKHIHNWASNNGYIDIARTCNTLLSTPSQFPCEMEVNVGVEDERWFVKTVEFVRNGLYFVNNGDCQYIAYNEARPIQPKQKTLADLKEGDDVWAIGECVMTNGNFKGTNVLEFGKPYKVLSIIENQRKFCISTIADNRHWFNTDVDKYILSPYPPSPQQIATARQAAIDEVNKRFDSLEKEVGNE